MILQAYERSELRLTDDYYCGKIEAAVNAYGMSYDFCRLYSVNEGLTWGNILLYNSAAVLGGSLINEDELADFIRINAPQTVECPRYTGNHLTIEGYEQKKRLLFRMVPDKDFDEKKFVKGVDKTVSLQQMFIILNSSFQGLQYDLWYADMSHRIRHEVSRAFTYKSASCANIEFCLNGKAYISSVATLPAARGHGGASGLLKHIAAMLSRYKIEGYLWCYEELADFYTKLGFKLTDDDIILIKKDNT